MRGSRTTRRIVLAAVAGASAVFALLLAAGAILGDKAMHVRRVPPGPTQNMDAAYVRHVNVTAPDGVPLLARLLPATAPGPARCAILLHGIGDHGANGSGLGAIFAQHGYSSLLPDSRAHGQSGGELATYGVLERNDLPVWISLLASMPECRGGIYAYGASMGAGILLQTLPREPRLRAIVAECSFSTFPEVARYRIRGFFHQSALAGALVARPLVWGGILYGRLRYGIDLAAASPEDSVAGLKTPILLIHGALDDNIPPAQSQAIAARNSSIKLWIVPGARHTEAASAAPEEFQRRVVGWFDSH